MYILKEKQAGNVIDVYENEEDALQDLQFFEEEDIIDGIYFPNFYEVVKK